jgi:hypothetical protein
MADELITPGLQPPRPDILGLAPGSGIRALQSTLADVEVQRQQALNRIAGLGAAPALQQPQPQPPRTGMYYNPSLDRFSVGGREFGREDYDVALQAPSFAGQAAPPPEGAGWRPMSPQEYQNYLSTISEGRGLFGNLRVGLQQTAEGILGGTGRGLEMLDAEGIGGALVRAGEAVGLSPAEQARSAAIYENQGLLGKIGTATVQSIPTLAAAVIPGVGAAGLAVRMGAAAGGLGARAAALGGVTSTIFPMELQSSWQTAEQYGLDPTDPEVQTDILMSTFLKTGVQTFGAALLTSGLSPALRRAVGDSVRRTMGGRILRGTGLGAVEGSAEAIAALTDRIAFDPELRAEFNEADWAALAPLIVSKYGEEGLVNFGAGFLLGGALGMVGSPTTEAPAVQRPGLQGTAPADVLQNTPPTEPAAPSLLGLPAPARPTGPLLLPPPTPPTPDYDLVTAAQYAEAVRGTEDPVGALYDIEQDLLAQYRGVARPDYEQAPMIRQARLGTPPLRYTPPAPSAPPMMSAAPPAATTETAIGAQFNRLLQQAQGRQAAPVTPVQPEPVAPAPTQPEPPAPAAAPGQVTPREYDAAYGSWEQIKAQQPNPDTVPSLARLNKKAQREWVDAVRAGTADAELFGRLVKRRVGRAEPLVETGVTRTSPAPPTAELDAMRQRVEAARIAEQERRLVQGQAATLRNLSQRFGRIPQPQRPAAPAASAAPTLPPNTYGTKDGKPFTSALAANGQRRNIAKRLGVPVEQLEIIAVEGGFAVRVRPEPEPTPPTPVVPGPTPMQETARTRRARGAAAARGGRTSAIQEPSPAPLDVRERAGRGQAVGEGDTQGQEAAGAGQAQVQVQAQVQAQEVTEPTLVDQVKALSVEERVRLTDLLNLIGEPDLDTALATNPEAVEVALMRMTQPRRSTPRRSQEEINADAAREAAARELANTRLETPTPVVEEQATVVTGDTAADLWNDIYNSLSDKGDLVQFVELTEGQQARWRGLVDKGKFNEAKSTTLSDEFMLRWADTIKRGDPLKEFQNIQDDVREQSRAPVDADMSAALESVQDAAKRLGGARRRVMTQEEIDDAVDLYAIMLDSDAGPDAKLVAQDVLESELSPKQYAEVESVFQLRDEIERLTPVKDRGSDTMVLAQRVAELSRLITVVNAAGKITSDVERRFTALVRKIKELRDPTQPEPGILNFTRAVNDARPNMQQGKIRPRERGFKMDPDGRTSLADFNTLDGALDLRNRPISKLPVGQVRVLAQAFTRKLAVRPNVSVFANQADLQRQNPELYARAMAARPQGDFADVAAAGYFFGGDNVILFTDRIAGVDHLNTVLAHEIMGHYGMRAIIGSRFSSVMESVYTNSPEQARALIDDAMAARGMSRAEATEEYLSDYAARIEVKTLARWWDAIKTALNKLGLKFGDEHARYLMRQARRYLSTGAQSSFFDAETMGLQMQAVENGTEPTGSGRFAQAQDATNVSALSLGRTVEMLGLPQPRSFDEALRWWREYAARNAGLNVGNLYDSLKQQAFTPTSWRKIRNEGFERVWALIMDRYRIARSHINRMQELREGTLRPAVSPFGVKLSKGLTEEQRANIGKVLKSHRIYQAYGAKRQPNPPKLFIYNTGTGEYEFQYDTYNKLIAKRVTREQFKEGIEIKYDKAVPMTPEIRQGLIVERDVLVARAKSKEEANRIENEYNKRINDNSYTDTETFRLQHDFTNEEWDAYVGELDAMAETSVQLLKSWLERFNNSRDTTYRTIARVMNAPMTESDRMLIRRSVDKFVEIAIGGAEYDGAGVRKRSSLDTQRAEAFAKTLNRALIGEGTDFMLALFDPNAEGAGGVPFFDAADRPQIEAAIKDFRTRYTPPKTPPGGEVPLERLVIQNEVRGLANELISTQDAETKAVWDIETAYVPFFREGNYQVRMAAVDDAGNEYAMTDRYREQMLYMQFDNEGQAQYSADLVAQMFGDTKHSVEVRDPEANNGLGGDVIKSLKLVPKYEAVVRTASTDPELNFNESIRFLRRFSINPNPELNERIIVALTSQNDRSILRQLKASFTPGSENDLTQAISQHIESRASTIARNMTTVPLAEALDLTSADTRKLWRGDRAKYDALKQRAEAVAADPNANEDEKVIARREFDQYHSWYVKNNAPVNGNKFYNEARSLVSFLDQQKQVLETDLASNPFIERVRTWTAVSFLSLSVASAALNVVGLATNVPAALMTYNSRNGYGGGFGFDGVRELFSAMGSVGISLKPHSGPDTADHWRGLSDAELKKLGVTRREAEFLANGIDGGFLDAAQFNSLSGSARGRVTTGLAQRFIETIMLPFNATEQYSRRAAALAAFRLEFKRQTNAGMNEADAADIAASFSENLVGTTLGNYTTANRPAFFRGGIQQFAFMFKQFVVTSATLMANLDYKGKLLMVGSLLLLSGLRGLPFAEDMEDLADTLAAKFGIPIPSAREYLINEGNKLAPGLGNMLMSGAINQFIPTDLGSRVSLGNIIPGTEMFLPGADTTRQLSEIGGPMVSFVQNSALTIGNLLDFAPGGMPGDAQTLLREFPVSMVKAWGDAYAFQSSGALLDRRGYVVSDEYNAGVALMRVLGFYPRSMSAEYDIVRIGRRRVEYLRSMTVAYRDAIVRAQASGDRDTVRYLYDEVARWNRFAAGTGLEIEGIRDKVARAMQAQRQLASERFIQSVPESARSYVEAYTGMFGG